jgi:hypothetical protein
LTTKTKFNMNRILPYMVLVIFFPGCTNNSGDVAPGGEIRIYSENPWYWEYKGEPVYLLGGSYEDNLYQFPNYYYGGHGDPNTSVGMTDLSLEEHMDKLVESGGNYLRASMSCRNYGNRFPYKKIEGVPGINLGTDIYDLDQWDEVWVERLETFLRMCHERNIIISIEFFDRWDLFVAERHLPRGMVLGSHNTGWEEHPWNPDRNINYTVESSGLPGGAISLGYDHELYHCVPALADKAKAPQPVVLETLRRYVDKILSLAFQYDNVLYIIENETTQPQEFGEYWVDYITARGREAGKNIYVTNMEERHDVNHPRQKAIRRAAKYMFYDHSQNTHKFGQEHYDNILIARADIESSETETGIKPITNVKVYGSITRGSVQDAKERWWRGIFAGLSGVRFHRPNYGGYFSGIGLGENAQTQIRSARMFTDEMNIFRCVPDNSLLSDRSPNEAFCLAEEGEQYAVYFTDGGSVGLDMGGASGEFSSRWLNIEESEWHGGEIITGGRSHTITAPSDGQWAVIIKKNN